MFIGCTETNQEPTFLNLDRINKSLSDSLSINLSTYKSVLEDKYSNQFIQDTILLRSYLQHDDSYLEELFKSAKLRIDYSDTSRMRRIEKSFQIMHIVFDNNEMETDKKNDPIVLKRKEIKTTYLKEIYVGNQFSRSVSVALIYDLHREGILTNDELNTLLIIRYLLIELGNPSKV